MSEMPSHAHYFQHWRNALPASERDAAVEYAQREAARVVQYLLANAKLETRPAIIATHSIDPGERRENERLLWNHRCS
jgi:hypothetical protein